MKLNELKPNPGARHRKKRVGRGPGGTDKTAGRGHKGQQSRSGSSLASSGSYKAEGGQVPMIRRLPKRGFNNPNKQQFHIINLSDLDGFAAGSVVNAESLMARRLIKKVQHPIKLLARGEVAVALTISVDNASAAAIEKVKSAGGSVTVFSSSSAEGA
ncbi:MAG: 50S ribosomal protein L15 [Deinococcales bacterium]